MLVRVEKKNAIDKSHCLTKFIIVSLIYMVYYLAIRIIKVNAVVNFCLQFVVSCTFCFCYWYLSLQLLIKAAVGNTV
jgi:hypothetical protein